jgi:hypothetical protein
MTKNFLTYRAHYFATEQAALLWRASAALV